MKATTFPLSPPISIGYRLTFNLKLFWILSLISILALLVLYIFQVNSLTREVYFIKSQEERLKTLTQENEALEVDFSKAGSLANLESYLQGKNFEKANQVRYIQILESSVVKSR